MADTKSIIAAQYRASLAMLGKTITQCPGKMWVDPRHNPTFWRIVYHTLFYTDLYLCQSVKTFVPRANHVKDYESLDPLVPVKGTPYTKKDLADYKTYLIQGVEARVKELDLAGPSGMPWIPFTKLELQFYNIRHVQHHAGQLTIWLREESGKEIEWVGMA